MRSCKLYSIVVFVCAIGVLPAAAQDSTLLLTNYFQQRYEFYHRDAVTQANLQNTRYAILQAGFARTNGEYRMAQQPTKEKAWSFNTSGIRSVGKFLVSGSFRYRHTLLDSLAYTLRNGLHEAAPYYFYAARNGHWETGRYFLQGTVTRPVSKAFNVGAGVQYESGNAWRSNDPRPEYFDHNMTGYASLRYNITPKHTIGIQGNLIKKNTETVVEYRNRDFEFNQKDYPDYTSYIQYGYGTGEVITSNRNLNSKGKGWGWLAMYDGKTAFGDITLKGGYKAIDSRFMSRPTVSGETEFTYGWFYEDVWTAGLYWQLQRGNNRISLSSDYYSHLGRDFNVKFHGNNYVYAQEYITVQPLFTHSRKGRPQYEAGIDAGVSDLFRADGNAGIVADYQNAFGGLRAAYYCWLPDASVIKAEVTGGWKGNISYELRYPVQQSMFIKEVIMRDAVYQTATVFNASAALTGQFTIKKLRTFIYTKGHYQQATLEPGTIPVTSLPGKERFTWEAGIGVIL